MEESASELEAQTQELLVQRAEREQLLANERDLRAEAERANRAKAEFLAVMSHELRTPLNAIGGYAQIIEIGMRGPVTDEQLSDLNRIQINQRHLLGLINNILNFTKLEAGEVEIELSRVNVGEVWNDLAAMVEPQMIERSLTLLTDDMPEQLHVVANAEKLRQVMLNLLTNALKFTPAGGEVALEVTYDEDTVTLAVRDSGRGIPPDRLENIFEPFVQVDRHITKVEDQGVGLGLAISFELVRAMGGTLRAESEVDVGSVFFVTLKRAE